MCRKMKDSGVEWIGDIPELWEVRKYKSVCNIYAGGTPDTNRLEFWNGDIPWLQSGKIKNSDIYEADKFITKLGLEKSSTKLIKENTTLLAMTGATCGNVAFLRIKSCANQSVMAFEVLNRSFLDRFIYYTLLSQREVILLQKAGGAQSGINVQDGKNLLMPSCSCITQEQIVKYLDKKVSEIDDIILNQKSLIEKYKAYKQSLITETVTKGLNKNLPMKDSGIEWIGEIPSHWKVERIKYLIDFNPSYSENLNDDVSVSFAPMECVGNGYMNFKEAKLKDVKGKYTYFSDKDIIMAKVTPCFENGNIAIANDLINGVGFGSSELYVFRCKKVDNKFMFYYLRNSIFKEGCISTMTGTGGLKRVSSSFIENYYIGIPKIDEQKEIAEFLDKKCTVIDSLISKKEHLIEKLESYKKSLIYECVTGKRAVN